jgi:hypothetical protein
MCQQVSTFSFCSCDNGGSYPNDYNSTGACKCPDPCTELVIVSGPTEKTTTSSCQCPIVNGAASGGTLYITTITTDFDCDPITPPCTTTPPPTTEPPPPPNTCNNNGGGDN